MELNKQTQATAPEESTSKVRIAILGLGAISNIYLQNLTELFREVEIVGVCDLLTERARQVQEEYHIAKVYEDYQEMLKDPEVEIVLNLTRPNEHYATTKAALEAGKHVYSEKPLAATFEQGKELSELAGKSGLLLGGAPDTFMGAGIQTCRKLIDDGFIGRPIAAAAFMICRGHESWHPAPEFYYKNGGGPMMDMGPYYLTALVNLLGGVKSVTGVTARSFEQRTITSKPQYGEVVDVEVPTHVTGIMEFDNGAVGTILTTFDVHYDKQARLEIYGTEGTLLVPDPNGFGGPISLLRPEEKVYKEMPLTFAYQQNSRGLGIADMAKALRTGRDPRAVCEQTLHVLELMTGFEKSSQEGRKIELETAYHRGTAMKSTSLEGILD